MVDKIADGAVAAHQHDIVLLLELAEEFEVIDLRGVDELSAPDLYPYAVVRQRIVKIVFHGPFSFSVVNTNNIRLNNYTISENRFQQFFYPSR